VGRGAGMWECVVGAWGLGLVVVVVVGFVVSVLVGGIEAEGETWRLGSGRLGGCGFRSVRVGV
jgi:hypothetical protein